MRAVVQRVSSAAVHVDRQCVGSIGPGLLVLLGVGHSDGTEQARWLAEKTVHLRIFEDEQGKMNRSLLETKGQLLAVSQFTLWGDCRKGRRPSFAQAAPPELAEQLYEQYVDAVRQLGVETATGRFRAHMQVSLTNDGPVTLWLDTDA